MKPDTQQKCLTRFLTVQPLTGWPTWDVSAYSQLRLKQIQADGKWRLQGKDKTDHEFGTAMLYVSNHEALCIIQAHLLSKLAEYTAEQNELVQIHMAHGDVAVPGVNVYGGLDLRSQAPTLIEALLDFFEQIQREQSDEAV